MLPNATNPTYTTVSRLLICAVAGKARKKQIVPPVITSHSTAVIASKERTSDVRRQHAIPLVNECANPCKIGRAHV